MKLHDTHLSTAVAVLGELKHLANAICRGEVLSSGLLDRSMGQDPADALAVLSHLPAQIGQWPAFVDSANLQSSDAAGKEWIRKNSRLDL